MSFESFWKERSGEIPSLPRYVLIDEGKIVIKDENDDPIEDLTIGFADEDNDYEDEDEDQDEDSDKDED